MLGTNENFLMSKRIKQDYFYSRNALTVAEGLLGKILVRDFGDGEVLRLKIVETEAYFGPDDLASHASKGRTKRTEIMFAEGGVIYAYLIYGMHWLLNIVTGPKDHPEAVLIRGVDDIIGPGRVGKRIGLNRSFYGENLEFSKRIWIENGTRDGTVITSPRIGIDYAGEVWKNMPWRFELK